LPENCCGFGVLVVLLGFYGNARNKRHANVTNKQQTTNNKQRTTNNKQQTTNNKQQAKLTPSRQRPKGGRGMGMPFDRTVTWRQFAHSR
jgi:hypothetical protein